MRDHSDIAQLEQLLKAIPAEELAILLGKRRFYGLHRLVSGGAVDSLPDALIARYAVALEGRRLLEEPSVLSALLLQMGSGKLRSLAHQYLEQPFVRDADNAMALASKPLRARSALSRDILTALGLNDTLLQEVERKPAVEIIEPYEPLPDLMDYQLEVRHQCLELLKAGVGELLIQMPTGSGKTRTAMELVVDLAENKSWFVDGNSVIWLAHTEELCEQAIDSFSAVWAQRGTARGKIARLWGVYTPSQSDLAGALVVAGTSRVHALQGSDPITFKALCSRSTVIVVDEAHRALAPTVQAQISELRRVSRGVLIGLSATPVRSTEPSEENAKLAKLFGRNLVTPPLGDDPIGELRRRGILAAVERIELSYSGSEYAVSEMGTRPLGDDDDLPESLLTALAENVARNSAIISELQARVSANEPAIVFCCSIAHAELLTAALRLKEIRAAAVDCRMRRASRRLIIQQFSRGELDVLLNYGVLSTGFDAPNVRTVVIARPTKSIILYSQMLGRGLRGPKMGGTAACTLVDVRDHLGRFGDLSDLYQRFKPYWTNSERVPGRERKG